MSIKTKPGPFINENCKLNPKTHQTCVNGSMKANFNVVNAPMALPRNKHGPELNFSAVITGVRCRVPHNSIYALQDFGYCSILRAVVLSFTGLSDAWHLGCCPSGQSVCPPNSCPIRKLFTPFTAQLG